VKRYNVSVDFGSDGFNKQFRTTFFARRYAKKCAKKCVREALIKITILDELDNK